MGDLIRGRIANETAAAAATKRRAAAAASGRSNGGGGGVGDDPEGVGAGHDEGILMRTGPGIWSQAVHQ
jgi:hypothetical protein